MRNGTTPDVTRSSGFQSDNHGLLHGVETFTCDYLSAFGAATDSFKWTIVSGTGAYANLRGKRGRHRRRASRRGRRPPELLCE
jgi:hypothetical protein